jgi:hypothetical protein
MSFRDYEADYMSQLDSIKKDIQTLNNSLSQANRAKGKVFNRFDIVKRLLEQHSHMKGSLAHMELESNEGTPEQRAQYKQRLTEFKKESFALEREVNRLKQEATAADRADLINRVTPDPNAAKGGASGAANAGANPGSTDAQLAELTKNTQTMNKDTDTLKKALQYVVRMNEHGEATLIELRRQDETTDRMMITGHETDAELGATQRLLRDMKAIAMKNNLILAGTVIVLVMMIVGLLYWKFGRPLAAQWENSSSSSSPSSSPASSPSTVVGAPSVSPVQNTNTFAFDGLQAAPSNLYSLQPFIPS